MWVTDRLIEMDLNWKALALVCLALLAFWAKVSLRHWKIGPMWVIEEEDTDAS